LNVLVTGIAGFIGSRLAAKLVEQGDNVYGLVRHSSERELNRIGKIVPKIHLIEGDLVRFHSVLSAVETSDPNIVFHLGALTPVRLSFDDPYPYIGINFDGTVNLVHSIVKQSPNTRLIAASTAEVYGWQPSDRAILESALLNPASPYAVSNSGRGSVYPNGEQDLSPPRNCNESEQQLWQGLGERLLHRVFDLKDVGGRDVLYRRA